MVSKLRWKVHLSRFGVALASAMLAGSAAGQTLPSVTQASVYPTATPIEYRLWEGEQLAATFDAMSRVLIASGGSTNALTVALERRGIELRADRRVHCEIYGANQGVATDEEIAAAQAELDAVRAAVAAVGGEIPVTWMKRFDAWIPVRRLTELATLLPTGYFLARSNPPGLDDVTGEGPAQTHSDLYQEAGADGTGVTVGVIDTQYDNFNAAQGNGDVPPAAQLTVVDSVGGAFGGAGANRHGTGCVENVFDHAPGANYRVYRIANTTHLGAAVTNMIAQAAPRLISHSLSWYNTGWADSSGPACAAALNAAQNGVLFFTSAGNRALSHYQATFVSAAGNPIPGWHQFGAGDETNDINIPNNQTVSFYLQWNSADNTTDYDLYLYNNAITVELAKSINVGAANFESLSWTNTTGAAVNTHLGVRRMAGNAVEFEIFEATSSAGWQYLTSANSNTSPSNTNHQNVVSVGAVDHNWWGSPNGTNGIIENYSSLGPTNGGLICPDICGPTNTTGFSYPGGFGGTSSATPNSVGTTAAAWSVDTTRTPVQIRTAIYTYALTYRDWGVAGHESTYGRGGIILPEVLIDIYPDRSPNPIYLSRNYTIYVAVYGSETLDVANLTNTARFGRLLNSAPAAPTNFPPILMDLNGDGRQDAVLGFRTFDTNFQLADWFGILKGRLSLGEMPYPGWDTVVVNP
jgi:hypothetical protein